MPFEEIFLWAMLWRACFQSDLPMHALIGNCRQCGYSLIRLTAPRCPECGTAFDPEDPRTMILHESRLAEFLSKRTSLWSVFPAVLACAAAIAAHIFFPDATWSIPLKAAAILLAGGTLYIGMARYNFRSYLRKRQREAEKIMRNKK
jgi:hypothetical protein